MQDTALYQYLLGLKSPWTVGRVELNVTGQCVDVWAEHPEGALWACPTCAQEWLRNGMRGSIEGQRGANRRTFLNGSRACGTCGGDIRGD